VCSQLLFAGCLAGGAHAPGQDPTPQQQDIQNDKSKTFETIRKMWRRTARIATPVSAISTTSQGPDKDRVDRNQDQRDINHDRPSLRTMTKSTASNSAQRKPIARISTRIASTGVRIRRTYHHDRKP